MKTQVITVTSQMSLRSGINIIVSQRERAVNTGKLPEARETANKQLAVAFFFFVSDWLKKEKASIKLVF